MLCVTCYVLHVEWRPLLDPLPPPFLLFTMLLSPLLSPLLLTLSLIFHPPSPVPSPFSRAEEEAAGRARAEKEKRDLQVLLQETQDDLEAEKEARVKVEKMRRQLNEVRV